MGAWGVGMRANDTALDALAGVKDKKTAIKALKHELKQKEDSWGSRAESVLGIAEYMVENEYEIPATLLKGVKAALKSELGEARLECWGHSEERKGALERFRARLNGVEVDEEDLELDNLGLFGQLSTNGMTRSEKKAALRKAKKADG